MKFLEKKENQQAVGEYLNHWKLDRNDPLLELTRYLINERIPNIMKKVQNRDGNQPPLNKEEMKIMKLEYALKNHGTIPHDQTLFMRLGNLYRNPSFNNNTPVQNPLQNPLCSNSLSQKKIELTPQQKKLQLATILKAGEFYAQFLQDKGVHQPLYKGDKPSHIMYYEELQSKLKK